ncbi:metallophosphoesterase [Myxosarcina sp. GI1(2024)]
MALVISEPLEVERIAIGIANLPASYLRTKILQLSDLHYDSVHLSEELLARAIALSNWENPDLVVITGDFVTDDPRQIVRLARQLRSLISNKGWHQIRRNQLYVNRGLGTYAPGRIFCPPELTVITLESQSS